MGITFEDGMLGCTAREVRSNRKGNGGEVGGIKKTAQK